MTDEMQTLRDDIAYLKGLAEAGRDGANSGGSIILVAAGGLFGAASVVQWAALTGSFGATALTSNGAWLIAMLLFFAVLIGAKLRRGPATGSAQSAGLAWKGVGIGCFFIFAAIAAATWRTQNATLINFSPSIIFVLYGAAWMVAATVSRKVWLHLTAWGSFAASILTAWFINQPVDYLIYAAGLLLLAFLPGLVLLRGASQGRD